MIPNKDLSIDSENGKIVLNGDKYDLGTQGEIDTVVKSVRDYVNELGVKNLIPYPYVNTTQTINNVNFTDNGDGSISADNAASAITQFRLYGWTTGISPLLLRKGTYILSGCPSGGGINSLRLYIHNQDSSFTAMDDGEGTKFTLSNDTYVGIAIRVANGYDADGKTVYPMLRLASDINDDTYVQYAMTNKQLTDQLATKQDDLTFDTAPTENSVNPVTSGGVYTADKSISDTIGDITQTGITGASVAAQLEALDGAIKKTTVNTSTSANGNILIEMLQSEKTVIGCLLTRTDTGAGIISDLYTYDVSGTLYWGAHCRDANAAGAAVASTAVTGYVYYIDKPAINS